MATKTQIIAILQRSTSEPMGQSRHQNQQRPCTCSQLSFSVRVISAVTRYQPGSAPVPTQAGCGVSTGDLMGKTRAQCPRQPKATPACSCLGAYKATDSTAWWEHGQAQGEEGSFLSSTDCISAPSLCPRQAWQLAVPASWTASSHPDSHAEVGVRSTGITAGR